MFGELLLGACQKGFIVNTTNIADIFGDGSCEAHYKLDGNVLDNSGVYDGVNTGITFTTGKFGQAAVFPNLATANIALDSLVSWMQRGSFSISAWVRPLSLTSARYVIGFHVDSNIYYGFGIFINTNGTVTMGASATNAGLDTSVVSSTSIPTNDYSSVIVTVENLRDVKIYINGSFDASGTLSHDIYYTSVMDLFIGLRTKRVGYEYPFDGYIDQVRFFDRALKGEEITKLYLEKYFLYDPTPQDYIAYYPLTGTAENKAGGSYNGTENGGMTYVNDPIFGSVANFDGTNDYVDCNINNAVYHDCVSLWFYTATEITTNSTAKVMGTTNTSYTYNSFGTGAYTAHFLDETFTMAYVPSTTLPDMRYAYIKTVIPPGWHQIVMQWELTEYVIYLNGVKQTTYHYDTGYGPYPRTLLDLRIGARTLPTYYSGYMRSVRVYPRALTEAEVATIYNYERVMHPIPVDNGLVAYYPLASNSLDNYFNQYDGSVTGGVTYDGNSASFDGTGLITATNALGTMSGDWSMCFWFKTNMSVASYPYMYTNDNDFNGPFTRIGFNTNGAIRVYTEILGGALIESNTTTTGYNDNVVRHLAIVKIGTVAAIYINGVFLQNLSTKSGDIGGIGTIGFGSAFPTATPQYIGLMARIRHYNRGILADEVAEIFNYEKGDFGL